MEVFVVKVSDYVYDSAEVISPMNGGYLVMFRGMNYLVFQPLGTEITLEDMVQA